MGGIRTYQTLSHRNGMINLPISPTKNFSEFKAGIFKGYFGATDHLRLIEIHDKQYNWFHKILSTFKFSDSAAGAISPLEDFVASLPQGRLEIYRL